MFTINFFFAILLAAFLRQTLGHTYHLGDCPAVEPVSGFQMSKFLGPWYVIQKTSTASRCLTYNFTVGSEPGEYLVEQVSEHPVLGVASVDNKYHYTGTISVPSMDVPGKMTVKFPLNPIGSSSYIVFYTDYDSYAGIYTCQKLPASNRRSVSVLSRTKNMEKQVLDKIRGRMSIFGINPYDLSIIDHQGCPESPSINMGIDPNTFSSHNIAQGVKKAGEKLGDGVEFLLKGANKIYENFTTTETEKPIK